MLIQYFDCEKGGLSVGRTIRLSKEHSWSNTRHRRCSVDS